MTDMVYTISGLARRSEKQYPLLSGQSFLRAVFQRGKQCKSDSVSVAAVWQHLSQIALDLLGAKQKVNLSGLSMVTMPDFLILPNNGVDLFFGTPIVSDTQEVETTTLSSKADTCIVSSLNKCLGANYFQMKLFITAMGTNGITTRQTFW